MFYVLGHAQGPPRDRPRQESHTPWQIAGRIGGGKMTIEDSAPGTVAVGQSRRLQCVRETAGRMGRCGHCLEVPSQHVDPHFQISIVTASGGLL